MDARVQLEVVLLLEGLLADLTLEAPADAVRGEVPPEVSLALENLADGERETSESQAAGAPVSGRRYRLMYLLAVWAGEAVRGSEEMLLQSFLGGISALTLGTSEVTQHKKNIFKK